MSSRSRSSRSRSGELTTTSYALLGLLAVKPWSTYELAKQMDRTFSRFWPRARSKLYEEPKKLVEHGLATARAERTGRRPRTVYAITAKGRRAMARWMTEPAEGPVLEFEQLLKIFFAEQGTRADVLRALAGARAWADVRHDENVAVARSYLDGTGPFPERAAQLAVVGGFLDGFTELVREWSAWATDVVESWPAGGAAEAEPDRRVWKELVAGGAPFRSGARPPRAARS